MKTLLEKIEAAGEWDEKAAIKEFFSDRDGPASGLHVKLALEGARNQHAQSQWQIDALKIAAEALNKINNECACPTPEKCFDYTETALEQITELIPGSKE